MLKWCLALIKQKENICFSLSSLGIPSEVTQILEKKQFSHEIRYLNVIGYVTCSRAREQSVFHPMECGSHPEKAMRRISSAFKWGVLQGGSRFCLPHFPLCVQWRTRGKPTSHVAAVFLFGCILRRGRLVMWSSHLHPTLPEFCFYMGKPFLPLSRPLECSWLVYFLKNLGQLFWKLSLTVGLWNEHS